MKKAKIILAYVAFFSIAGGVLAFKVNRFQIRNVYTLLPGNKVVSIFAVGKTFTTTVPNCTLSNLHATLTGPQINASSTTTNAAITTIFRSGTDQITSTYAYCTLWVTRIEDSNE